MRKLPSILAALSPFLLAGCMHEGAAPARPSAGNACHGVGEPECIARTKGLVSRKGDALTVSTTSGKVVTYASEAQACADGISQRCRVYRLEAHRPNEGLLVLTERRSDAMASLVVDAATGAVTRIDNATPRFSPDGSRFAGVMSSEAHPPESDLAIWSSGAGSQTLEWSHPAAVGRLARYEFVSWEGEARIRLRVHYVPAEGGPDRHAEASITRGSDGWSLDKPSDSP